MKNILLVDDEKETSSVFQTGLTSGGYNVILAENGQQAIDLAKSQKFDLILLDQMMPDISGNEVLKSLKGDEATKQVPVAMLSNFGHDELIKEALNSGAVDYILKYQVAPADLIAKIKRIIGE